MLVFKDPLNDMKNKGLAPFIRVEGTLILIVNFTTNNVFFLIVSWYIVTIHGTTLDVFYFLAR